jgi:hypothetical protein
MQRQDFLNGGNMESNLIVIDQDTLEAAKSLGYLQAIKDLRQIENIDRQLIGLLTDNLLAKYDEHYGKK